MEWEHLTNKGNVLPFCEPRFSQRRETNLGMGIIPDRCWGLTSCSVDDLSKTSLDKL
ncbi:hypothetical protein V6Z11_A11G370700 [Gossypium hirsutum]